MLVEKYAAVSSVLDERGRRLWAVAESRAIGFGGDSVVSAALAKEGWRISSTSVGRLLNKLGYRLQSASKRYEGASDPDRDAQFNHINDTAEQYQAEGQLVISVDTKKKELVGDFKNNGREWQPKGKPESVLVHDFPQDALGKAVPYGIYDMARNEAWVNVGQSFDTPQFAVASIRRWWSSMGKRAYPDARTIFITADAGGSNGYRSRAWKLELQKFADDTGLRIRVSHFPPGTSKWNTIEHRLFCYITKNWRGKPLRTFEMVVELIANTRPTRACASKPSSTRGPTRRGSELPRKRWITSRYTPMSSGANGTTRYVQESSWQVKFDQIQNLLYPH